MKNFAAFCAAAALTLFAAPVARTQASQTRDSRNAGSRDAVRSGLSTRVARNGDPFTAIVAEPVFSGNTILLPAGAKIHGTITSGGASAMDVHVPRRRFDEPGLQFGGSGEPDLPGAHEHSLDLPRPERTRSKTAQGPLDGGGCGGGGAARREERTWRTSPLGPQAVRWPAWCSAGCCGPIIGLVGGSANRHCERRVRTWSFRRRPGLLGAPGLERVRARDVTAAQRGVFARTRRVAAAACAGWAHKEQPARAFSD